ncbi:hypothetical protein GCM10020360_18700 [Nonlabens tegetincola]
MPLGDTAASPAYAVERTQATPEANASDAAPEPTQPSGDDLAPQQRTSPGDGSERADAADQADAGDTDAGAADADPKATPDRLAAAPRAQAGPALTWSVADASGAAVAGATVTVQGPAKSTATGGVNWGKTYTVTDCAAGSCAGDSMDQDPRAGYFSVDRLVADGSVTRLTNAARGERFRIKPVSAPLGYEFTRAEWVEIPTSQWWASALPSPNPWAGESFSFGTLRVAKAEPLGCVAGTIYSVAKTGQLQQLVVNDKGTAAAVSIVGDAAPGRDRDFNGLGVGPGGTAAYAFERISGSHTNDVYRFNLAAKEWQPLGVSFSTANTQVNKNWSIGGAVDQNGTYWAGGFSQNGSRFQLWALEEGATTMEPRGLVEVPGPALGRDQTPNGDFAFDSLGNLYLIRGDLNSRALSVYRVDAAALKKASGVEPVRGVVQLPSAKSPFGGVNGIAYDPTGLLYFGSDSGGTSALSSVKLPYDNGKPSEPTLPRNPKFSTSDLASCGYPPTVTLQKNLPDGRVAAADQFRLELKSGDTSLGVTETKGDAVGPQPQTLGPIPVTSGGTISISETVVGNTGPGNYASRWECTVGGTVIAEGTGRSNATPITVPAMAQGEEVLCTFTNTIAQATKTAVPASGTAVHRDDAQGGIVRYTLGFDNSTGPTASDVLYSDYLADVLDDAVFVDGKGNVSKTPVVTTQGGIVYDQAKHWNPKQQILRVEGKVAAHSKASLSFSVRVLENSVNAEARQKASGAKAAPQGYFLRNKLARGTADTPPAECKPGLCTEHPIQAWSVTKGSLPADGARLHKGGNVHYKVTATKANAGTTLTGLVLEDDVTHVLKTAGWAPGAVVPGGAAGRGVYLFNADNRTIGLDGQPTEGPASTLTPVREVAAPTQVNVAPTGQPEDLRWIVTSGEPMDLPAEAVRAELWFAVQAAESPAERPIPDPQIWVGQGKVPTSGWKFANYATGTAKSGTGAASRTFAPNECATGSVRANTSLAPNAADPVDLSFPEQCRVQHELSQNYFTIRKDAGGAGVQALADDRDWDPDPTGLWNMVGHEFEIRDHDASTGKPTAYPSVQLCRTDYDPYAAKNPWRGAWVTPAAAADESRFAFGAEGAAIQQRILDWNNDHPPVNPGDKPLPVCGTIYEIGSGAQQGRWRSENLEAGDYWLVETKAPTAQAAEDATSRAPREVPGVQRLAQPIQFKIWPEQDGPSLGVSAMQGRGQLDVSDGAGGYLERCNPGQQQPNGQFEPRGTVAERDTACVNPTGYLMLVKDPVPAPLPLTGGIGPWLLWGGGALALAVAAVGTLWWRMRRRQAPRHAA